MVVLPVHDSGDPGQTPPRGEGLDCISSQPGSVLPSYVLDQCLQASAWVGSESSPSLSHRFLGCGQDHRDFCLIAREPLVFQGRRQGHLPANVRWVQGFHVTC